MFEKSKALVISKNNQQSDIVEWCDNLEMTMATSLPNYSRDGCVSLSKVTKLYFQRRLFENQ